MSKTFICAMCGCTGECGPEEEAEAKLKAEFGDINKEDCDVVCDDCWEKVRPINNPELFKAWGRFTGRACELSVGRVIYEQYRTQTSG